MKSLLISLVLVTGYAVACPDDASQNAAAPAASSKAVVAVKATPATKPVAAVAPTKSTTKVAAKPAATEPRKTASL